MLSVEFIKAWREWLRKPIPVTNFRNGHANAPSYELEHDIDHSVSYIRGLVRSLIAGEQLDYKKLASKEMSEVDQLLVKLDGCELDNQEKQKFLEYLTGMRLVLEQV